MALATTTAAVVWALFVIIVASALFMASSGQFYDRWFDAAHVSVIERAGTLIGVLDCTWHADRLEVNRIAIDPRYQGQGIGTEVLTELVTQADRRHLTTRLQVFDINPARRLYERLGELSAAGLIMKDGNGDYTLTSLGADLGSALSPLDQWSRRWARQQTKR